MARALQQNQSAKEFVSDRNSINCTLSRTKFQVKCDRLNVDFLRSSIQIKQDTE